MKKLFKQLQNLENLFLLPEVLFQKQVPPSFTLSMNMIPSTLQLLEDLLL